MRPMSVAWPWSSPAFDISAIERHEPQRKSGPRAAFFMERCETYFASSLNTSRAAATVVAMSSSLCAALTNPAS